LNTAAALRFAALSGPPTAPLPRKRLASSAAGGASPLFHRCGNAVCGPFQVRQPRRCLESGSLLPPQAALRRFSTVAAMRFAVPFGSANRAAASKAARFFLRRRRFAAFPPLRHCGLRTFQVRKSRRCLESGSLLPPLFHRCGNAVCGPFGSANRAAASKATRFFRRRRRFAAFPPPFEKAELYLAKRPAI